jgi:hypothetical protein
MRVQFANDAFEMHRSIVVDLRDLGLTIDDLVRAICDSTSYFIGVSSAPNRDGDEHEYVVCPSVRPSLLVGVWYHRDAPRYIYVEEVSRQEG